MCASGIRCDVVEVIDTFYQSQSRRLVKLLGETLDEVVRVLVNHQPIHAA